MKKAITTVFGLALIVLGPAGGLVVAVKEALAKPRPRPESAFSGA